MLGKVLPRGWSHTHTHAHISQGTSQTVLCSGRPSEPEPDQGEGRRAAHRITLASGTPQGLGVDSGPGPPRFPQNHRSHRGESPGGEAPQTLGSASRSPSCQGPWLRLLPTAPRVEVWAAGRDIGQPSPSPCQPPARHTLPQRACLRPWARSGPGGWPGGSQPEDPRGTGEPTLRWTSPETGHHTGAKSAVNRVCHGDPSGAARAAGRGDRCAGRGRAREGRGRSPNRAQGGGRVTAACKHLRGTNSRKGPCGPRTSPEERWDVIKEREMGAARPRALPAGLARGRTRRRALPAGSRGPPRAAGDSSHAVTPVGPETPGQSWWREQGDPGDPGLCVGGP